MAKVLYLQASPRTERSHSICVADGFVQEYQKLNPDDAIEKQNLFETKLPEMDNTTIQGKYNIMQGRDFSPEEKAAWSEVEAVIEHFKSFDKYVFALPMWNFTIPYKLKHYLDVIIQPTYTFNAGEGGYEGLVTGKPAICVYARGGEYTGEKANFDLQTKYFEQALGFIGFENIKRIIVEPTLAGGPEAAKQARQNALENAEKLTAGF